MKLRQRWLVMGWAAGLSLLGACSDTPQECPEPGDDDCTCDWPGETPTQVPTGTPVVTPTEKPEVTPTEKPEVTPTEKPEVTPTDKPEVTPTEKPEVTPTQPTEVTPTPSGQASLGLETTALAFDPLPLGELGEAWLTVSNTGTAPLSLRLALTTLSGGVFLVEGDTAADAVVAPYGTDQLSVTFEPLDEGLSTGFITVTANDPDRPYLTITLKGEGTASLSDDQDRDGYTATGGDCDDEDPQRYPGAFEACDGKDNDCDGKTDENGNSTFFLDADGDGRGDPEASLEACNPPSQFVTNASDCNDQDPSVYQGAPEQCDTKDNDCDGETDEGVSLTFYPDIDMDGYGDVSQPISACAAGAGEVPRGGDCNDNEPTVFTGATERCDAVDNDCDGQVDEDLPLSTYYSDKDLDGHGNASQSVQSCGEVPGSVSSSDDCNDQDDAIYPGAKEACDTVDNDCDGQVDEDGSSTWYTDADGDGHGNPSTGQKSCAPSSAQVALGDDCDDTSVAVFPGAAETCDTKDNNCNGQVDEGLGRTFYKDADADGYGAAGATSTACSAPAGYVTNSADCDDSSLAVNPAATERCNGLDDNCDGQTDEGVKSPFWPDRDSDGYGSGSPTQACAAPAGYVGNQSDCDDANAGVNPKASEVCDAADNDCDGQVDDGVKNLYYEDSDSDAYGSASVTTEGCKAPAGYTDRAGDCDDTSAAVNPVSAELCDSLDNDCDGQVDEGVKQTWYQDGDSDTYGSQTVSVQSCTQPGGYVARGGDCNDAATTTNPAASEVCDGQDNNCNGTVDEAATNILTWYKDGDGDGYGTPSTTQKSCEKPTGYVDNSEDCNDANAAVNPQGQEVAGNGIDENCDGVDGLDLNGDGYPDIIMSSYYNGAYGFLDNYVYYGGEKGVSSRNRDVLPANSPMTSCVADFNNDGLQDILFPGWNNGHGFEANSMLYWNSEDGFDVFDFTELPSIGAYDCVADDFNKDGWIDVALANYWDGTNYNVSSYVYWNSSAGFNRARRTSLQTYGSEAVVSVDINKDGYKDLLFSNYRNASTYSIDSYIYWGSSAGFSNTNRTALPTQGSWRKAAVADLNKDGSLDVVMVNHYNGSYTVNSYVYYGPAFSTTTRTELPSPGGIDVDVNDYDKDGYLDIALASYNDGDYSTPLYVYFGSSRGYSTNNRQTLQGYGQYNLSAKDVNEDGYLDLMVADYYDGDYSTSSYVYYGSNIGFSTSSYSSLGGYGVRDIDGADVDQDGYMDVVINSHYDGDYYSTGYVYYGTPRGIGSNRTDLPTLGVNGVTIEDLNKDSWPDIIFGNHYNGTYSVNSYIYWGAAGGYSSSSVTSLPTNGHVRTCVADLNSDGYKDIFFANYINGSTRKIDSYIYWNSATGFVSTNRTALPTIGGYDCALVDLDGDKDLEVVVANYYTDSSYSTDSYIYWNDKGTFATSNRTALPTLGASGVSTGDVNKDGYVDLVFTNYYDGSSYNPGSYIYFGSTTGYSTTKRQTLASNGPWGRPAIGDFNGDGWPDIALAGEYDGDNSLNHYVHYGSASGFNTTNVFVYTAARAEDVKAEDLDKDGYTDLVIPQYYDGDHSTYSIILWGSKAGLSATDRTLLFTYGVHQMTIEDLDQDGWKDLVFTSHYDGNYTTTTYVYMGSPTGFNQDGAIPLTSYGGIRSAAADLDKDGYLDLVIGNYYVESTYSLSSFIYWNSPRGLGATGWQEVPSTGGNFMTVVQ